MKKIQDFKKKIQQVRQRMIIRSIAQRSYSIFFISASLLLALIITARLSGLFAFGLSFQQTAIITFVSSLLGGLLLAKRTKDSEAAQTIDTATNSDDLYLTVLYLHGNESFGHLITDSASHKSDDIRPATVVPFSCTKQLGKVLLFMLITLLATAYLPQLDPFHKQKSREIAKEKERQVLAIRKAIAARKKELKKKNESGENSKEVKTKLQQLVKEFSKFEKQKPKVTKSNIKKMKATTNELRKNKLQEKMRQSLKNRANNQQMFGNKNFNKLNKLQKMVNDKNMDALKKALQDDFKKMQDIAKKLASSKDEANKKELQKKLNDKIKEMMEMSKSIPELNSQAMQDALKQAMKQASTAMQNPQLSKQAMENMQNALQMSEMEMGNMLQNMQDIQDLENALQALQMAQQLNKDGKLQGKKCEGGNKSSQDAMQDYLKMYTNMLAQGNGDGAGKGKGGKGKGMSGQGQGKGGLAKENNEQKNSFKKEQANSTIVAGKVLMKMTVKKQGLTAESRRRYMRSVELVKQDVDEAIIEAKIPPNKQEAIRKYFSQLEKIIPQDKKTTEDK